MLRRYRAMIDLAVARPLHHPTQCSPDPAWLFYCGAEAAHLRELSLHHHLDSAAHVKAFFQVPLLASQPQLSLLWPPPLHIGIACADFVPCHTTFVPSGASPEALS
jgi:hypothetical protein